MPLGRTFRRSPSRAVIPVWSKNSRIATANLRPVPIELRNSAAPTVPSTRRQAAAQPRPIRHAGCVKKRSGATSRGTPFPARDAEAPGPLFRRRPASRRGRALAAPEVGTIHYRPDPLPQPLTGSRHLRRMPRQLQPSPVVLDPSIPHQRRDRCGEQIGRHAGSQREPQAVRLEGRGSPGSRHGEPLAFTRCSATEPPNSAPQNRTARPASRRARSRDAPQLRSRRGAQVASAAEPVQIDPVGVAREERRQGCRRRCFLQCGESPHAWRSPSAALRGQARTSPPLECTPRRLPGSQPPSVGATLPRGKRLVNMSEPSCR